MPKKSKKGRSWLDKQQHSHKLFLVPTPCRILNKEARLSIQESIRTETDSANVVSQVFDLRNIGEALDTYGQGTCEIVIVAHTKLRFGIGGFIDGDTEFQPEEFAQVLMQSLGANVEKVREIKISSCNSAYSPHFFIDKLKPNTSLNHSFCGKLYQYLGSLLHPIGIKAPLVSGLIGFVSAGHKHSYLAPGSIDDRSVRIDRLTSASWVKFSESGIELPSKIINPSLPHSDLISFFTPSNSEYSCFKKIDNSTNNSKPQNPHPPNVGEEPALGMGDAKCNL
jgi:hypothetical protein